MQTKQLNEDHKDYQEHQGYKEVTKGVSRKQVSRLQKYNMTKKKKEDWCYLYTGTWAKRKQVSNENS